MNDFNFTIKKDKQQTTNSFQKKIMKVSNFKELFRRIINQYDIIINLQAICCLFFHIKTKFLYEYSLIMH